MNWVQVRLSLHTASGILTGMTPEPDKTIKSPPRRRKSVFGRLLNLLLLVAIIVTIGLFVWAEQQRRSVRTELQQTTQQLEELRKSSQQSGAEVAARVLEKLRKHMDIPSDPEPTVATIVDIERLRESNSDFYGQAENGDHLIITKNRAVLYDPDRDLILDVVPVQLNEASPAPSGSPRASASPSPVVTSSGSPVPTTSPALRATPSVSR